MIVWDLMSRLKLCMDLYFQICTYASVTYEANKVLMDWLSHRQKLFLSASLILLCCGICILLCLLWPVFLWHVVVERFVIFSKLRHHVCLQFTRSFVSEYILQQDLIRGMLSVEWVFRHRGMGIVQLLGVLFCHLMSVDPLHKLMTTQQYGETSPLITPFSVRLSLTLIGFSFPFFGW